jgi:hypothetical protein
MYADTNEELHEFAAKIGLRREWFQKSTSGPHYDLTVRRRAAAVKLGAIEHTDREMVDHMNRWTAESVALIKAALTEEEQQKIREWIYR